MPFDEPDPAETDEPTPQEKYGSIPDDPSPDDNLVVVDSDASCEDCIHQDVCVVYNQFAARLSQSFNEPTPGADEPPVDPAKLAWHCELYDTGDRDEDESPKQRVR